MKSRIYVIELNRNLGINQNRGLDVYLLTELVSYDFKIDSRDIRTTMSLFFCSSVV